MAVKVMANRINRVEGNLVKQVRSAYEKLLPTLNKEESERWQQILAVGYDDQRLLKMDELNSADYDFLCEMEKRCVSILKNWWQV